LEIFDGGAFAKKFGKVNDLEAAGFDEVAEKRIDEFLRRAGQHGAAENESVVLGGLPQGGGDLRGDLADEFQVERAGDGGWSADADEGKIASGYGFVDVCCGAQLVFRFGRFEEFFEAGFDDGRLAAVKGVDFLWINVHADDREAFAREATRGDCADVSETENADLHSA